MTPPPNRMRLLEADLASRSAEPARPPQRHRRRRSRSMQVDDGTPVSMSIGGRPPGSHSAALTTEPEAHRGDGRTVAPLVPAAPTAPTASPASAPGSAPQPTPPAAPVNPPAPLPPVAVPLPASQPATSSSPSAEAPGPSPAPTTSTGGKRPAQEDESFKDDLMAILASHRPDPASPPVPEPAPAPPAPPEDHAPELDTARSAAQSHAVFDRLGRQMSTATTYDLGPMALERRLDELDQVIAAEVDTAETARARADRAGTLRSHDDLLDVGEVRAALATTPTPPPVPPARRIAHDVRLTLLRPGLTCAAAAAASLVAWRDRIDPSSDDLPAGTGPWAPYADGRQARGPADLAAWGLTVSAAPSVAGVLEALEAHGPLWVAAAPVGEHAVVVSGATTDGVDTRLTVLDPCAAEAGPIEESWPGLRTRVGAADGLPLTLAHLTTS